MMIVSTMNRIIFALILLAFAYPFTLPQHLLAMIVDSFDEALLFRKSPWVVWLKDLMGIRLIPIFDIQRTEAY